MHEGNALFNDTLNTFYLRLHGVEHMVKDHSESERGNSPPPHHGYSFRSAARGVFHSTAFATPAVELWLERERSQWVNHEAVLRASLGPSTFPVRPKTLHGPLLLVGPCSGGPLLLVGPCSWWAPRFSLVSLMDNAAVPRGIDPMTYRTMSEALPHS